MNTLRNPSSYPVLISLIILGITTTTLAIGDEQLAEELTIYAYYFLVTGIVIRFIELSLPEEVLKKLTYSSKPYRIISIKKNNGSMYIRNTGIMLENLYSRPKLYLRRVILEMRVRISDFNKRLIHEQNGVRVERQYLFLQRFHIIEPGKNVSVISDIFRNIAIFLSGILILSLIYGMAIDWGFVEGYIYNLIYAIIAGFALYIILRVRIFGFKKPPLRELIYAQNEGMLRRQYLTLRRLHIVNPGKNIVLISDIFRNIAIFLSIFLLISLIYGLIIDWWYVERYFYNLIYTILGCFTFYILLRVRF